MLHVIGIIKYFKFYLSTNVESLTIVNAKSLPRMHVTKTNFIK